MRQFVPMSDDVFDDPLRFDAPLVPYRCGVPCWHQLRADTAAERPQPNATAAADDVPVSVSR